MNQNQPLDHEILVNEDDIEKHKQSLPKASFMGSNLQLIKYQGFWCPASLRLNNILTFQTHFQARDSDLIIASLPKTGTTWLKSLLYSIVNRKNYTIKGTPLLTHHPHELVYRLENGIYGDAFVYPRPQHLNELPSPRLLHTHLPYMALADSIKKSKCRILYVGRNPLDTLVSQWKFYPNAIKKQMGRDYKVPSIEEIFEDFIEGKLPYGPFFEHILGYWKQSLERPNKVLFMKYEDLKSDTIFELKKLAEFVGCPFSNLEENDGAIKEIIELCSINNLKNLEVNKNGAINKFFEKDTFFRKGEVGDWTNHFTSSMVDRIKLLMEEELKDSGLSFQLSPS